MDIIQVVTVVCAVFATFLAWLTIHHSNENSKREVLTEKHEEIFSIIQTITGKYYHKLDKLNGHLEANRGKGSLDDYYRIRDLEITRDDIFEIYTLSSKIAVLSSCYTKDKLLEDLLYYEKLIYGLADYTFNGGSLFKELNWPRGFPPREEYYKLEKRIKDEIINEIRSSLDIKHKKILYKTT